MAFRDRSEIAKGVNAALRVDGCYCIFTISLVVVGSARVGTPR